MIVYLAAFEQLPSSVFAGRKDGYLTSYFSFTEKIMEIIKTNNLKIFLDSGAFSAFTRDVVVDIDKYIEFIGNHEKYLNVYSVLDVINDSEKTLENQKYMEANGLRPLPCFHYGEDIYYLKKYLSADHGYIALGGMVPVSNDRLKVWLDDLFANQGLSEVNVHGFGMTSVDLILRYPWFSVDSTTWHAAGRFGEVIAPRQKDYALGPYRFIISSRRKDNERHFLRLSKLEQNQIQDYFECLGYSIEELADEENTNARYAVNAQYFIDLEKNYKPKPFVHKRKSFKF